MNTKELTKINIIFDNNVWDFFHTYNFNLHGSVIHEKFNLYYPRAIKVEHANPNTPPELQRYIQEQLTKFKHTEPAFFGFADQPASSSFGFGVMADTCDYEILASGNTHQRPRKPFPKKYGDELILAIASHFNAYIVTYDNKSPYTGVSNTIILDKDRRDLINTEESFSSYLLSIINNKQ